MKQLTILVGALTVYVLVRMVRDQRSALRSFSAGGVSHDASSTTRWDPNGQWTYTAHGCAEVE